MATTKQVLKKLAYHIELNTYTLAALEIHIQSSESGKQLTNRELNKWKRFAKTEMKSTFDQLDELIRSLPIASAVQVLVQGFAVFQFVQFSER